MQQFDDFDDPLKRIQKKYSDNEGGLLTNAANLTKANHAEALCLWILSL